MGTYLIVTDQIALALNDDSALAICESPLVLCHRTLIN
jgi:hypothetical protein